MRLAGEFSGPQTLIDDIVRNPIPIIDGYARPLDEPGLGVELDEEKLSRFGEKPIICE
jgi:L-alanine-DL-glutamate epimerase-like enolase superfamily enzyme